MRPIHLCLAGAAALLAAAGPVACAPKDTRGPYQAAADDRDGSASAQAEALYQHAVALQATRPAVAEAILRSCLGLSPFHGQAHHLLGLLLFADGRLYDAIEEFSWACRLLPGDPDLRADLERAREQLGTPPPTPTAKPAGSG
jgi:hypothetical protein